MTDDRGIDHVIDAIDNALSWTEPWADAMTVQYGANGDSGPGVLAEPPGRYPPDGAASVVMSAEGIEWYDADSNLTARLPVVDHPLVRPDAWFFATLAPDEHEIYSLDSPDPVRTVQSWEPVGFTSEIPAAFTADGDTPPSPAWRVTGPSSGTVAAAANPGVPRIDPVALRRALANIPPPRFEWTPSPSMQQMERAIQNLEIELQEWQVRAVRSFSRAGRAFIQMRASAVLAAGPLARLDAGLRARAAAQAPTEPGPRERALEARRNRNTGPARNPHRHRGI